ncbi:MAG: UDP-N-acetylmuramoyl-tripeptide--D-alanyl-D-alanine ligase [Candidatus Omnitrophota bacterium]
MMVTPVVSRERKDMFRLNEIVKWTNAQSVNMSSDRPICGISIDSRTIKKAELFVAICGDKFNGHDYLFEAEEKRASAVLINKKWADFHPDQINGLSCPVILVENTNNALMDMAKGHRKKFNIPVIAVTGSNGKTTTKEMLAEVLSARFKVLKSKASFNNNIGVPLSILELNAGHDAAVLELGMNHPGEIRILSSIVRPNIAIITNVAAAHLGFFNSVDEIISAKCELIEKANELDLVISNADCLDLFHKIKEHILSAVGIGIKNKCSYQASNVISRQEGVAFTLNLKDTFRLNLLGEHNVYNALCAIAVADHFKIDMSIVRERLKEIKPAKMRMERINFQGIEIIADCYNANPQSVTAAIETLAAMSYKKRRIFILGDMLELGTHSDKFHAQIGELFTDIRIDKLVTIGEKAALSAEVALKLGNKKNNVFMYDSVELAQTEIFQMLKEGDVVLIKGSRLMQLEKLIPGYKL